MAEAYVDKVANELADLALADQARTGDVGIVDAIGEVLGASSQTLQETYLTAVRVRRAEHRARTMLAERAGQPVVPLAELITDESSARGAGDDIEDAEIAQEPPTTYAPDQKVAAAAAVTKTLSQIAVEAPAPDPVEFAKAEVVEPEEDMEAELEAAAARIEADKEAKAQAAKEEARVKQEAEDKAKAEQEAIEQAKAAAAASPISGPWDLEEGAEPAPAPVETPATPRRVKR